MTDPQYNKTLTLLIGECWHEWEWETPTVFHCKLCGHKEKDNDPPGRWVPSHPDHLSNPLPVIRWMEKEMPEVWEKYLYIVFWAVRLTYAPDYRGRSERISKVLDLRNLVEYLWEHQEWGERECEKRYDYCIQLCGGAPCNGTGKLIHPALKYLKEVHNEGN